MLDVLRWFIIQFWWALLIVGIFTWLLVMSIVRTIKNTVLYIRKGNTMEFHPCIIQGTNIKFKPEKSKKAYSLTAYMDAKPYTLLKGLNTYRVYVVKEGLGKTVRFPQKSLKGFLEEHGVLKQFEKYAKKKGFGKIYWKEEEGMAASASSSFFERFSSFMGENLAKRRAQMMMVLIYILMGFSVGLGWGLVASKAGWM